MSSTPEMLQTQLDGVQVSQTTLTLAMLWVQPWAESKKVFWVVVSIRTPLDQLETGRDSSF